jgi:UDP-glucose 4-epimerase
VVAIFGRAVLTGEPITVFGDGEQTRDYVYVGDVVAANLAASDLPLGPVGTALDERAYNVGTGVETSVNALATAIMAVGEREVEVKPAPARPGELQHSSLQNEKLKGVGWAPSTPLEVGLRHTLDHIREHV